MSATDNSVNLIWPQPPKGHKYVEQTLPGGTYRSTGYFKQEAVDSEGNGRNVENVAVVTSLFFDADLIGLFEALRAAQGTPLVGKIAAKKAELYKISAEEITVLKRLLFEFTRQLTSLLGNPTVMLDSGWGLHLHYALAADCNREKAGLARFHQSAVKLANKLIEKEAEEKGISGYSKAFDPTHDVGARLARIVGSLNTKAPNKPLPCRVISGTNRILSAGDIFDISMQNDFELIEREETKKKAEDTDTGSKKSKKSDKADSEEKETRVDIDFRTAPKIKGMRWSTIVDRMGNGKELKVVCPFAGTSVGSGFFRKDLKGRYYYRSNAQNITYFDIRPKIGPKAAKARDLPGEESSTDSDEADVSGYDYLTRDRKGVIESTPDNLLSFLADENCPFKLWYNEYTYTIMVGDRPIRDVDYLDISVYLKRTLNWDIKVGKATIMDCMERRAVENSRNIVKEKLEKTEWDGEERLKSWLSEVLGVENSPLYEAYGIRWFISLVARAYDPGCKVDTVLTLKGPQGLKKSTLFETIAAFADRGLFIDTKTDFRNKDGLSILSKCWIYEDAELASTRMADAETLKSIFSGKVDSFRPAYGRFDVHRPRRCVIVGTSNNDIVLKDPTGNRRYWVVDCFKSNFAELDLASFEKVLPHLFGEAVHRYKAGEQHWLTPDEQELQRTDNSEHAYHDSYSEYAAIIAAGNAGGKQNEFTMHEFCSILKEYGYNIDPQRQGLSIGSAFSKAGFKRRAVKGYRTWYLPLPDGVEALSGQTGLQALRDFLGGNRSQAGGSFTFEPEGG